MCIEIVLDTLYVSQNYFYGVKELQTQSAYGNVQFCFSDQGLLLNKVKTIGNVFENHGSVFGRENLMSLQIKTEMLGNE